MGKRFALCAALTCAAGLAASVGLADDYPSRPVRVVVGFSAGQISTTQVIVSGSSTTGATIAPASLRTIAVRTCCSMPASGCCASLRRTYTTSLTSLRHRCEGR